MQNVTDLVSLAKPGMSMQLSVKSSERVCSVQALMLNNDRLIHMPDFLERRPRYRELHHPIHFRRYDEEVGTAN